MDWAAIHLGIFIPMLSMILVFALNHAVSHRRSNQQIRRDIRGLRAALLAELVLLRGLIADNLALVARGEEYLLSFRVLTQVYRSNVGRLNLLDEAEINAVISAYGTTEAAEVIVGAVTRAHGAHAYRVWLGDSSWQDIGRRLAMAHAAVRTAIDQLQQQGARPAPDPAYDDIAAVLPTAAIDRFAAAEIPALSRRPAREPVSALEP